MFPGWRGAAQRLHGARDALAQAARQQGPLRPAAFATQGEGDEIAGARARQNSGVATGAQSYSLSILPPVAITPTTLPAATVGLPYSQTLQATGGTGSYSWGVTSGALPAWSAATPRGSPRRRAWR